jgi:hypothetical protein
MFNYLNPPDLKPPSKPMHWFKLSYNQMYWTSPCADYSEEIADHDDARHETPTPSI